MIMRKGMEGKESIDRPVTKSIMIKKHGNAFQRSLSIDNTCEGSLSSSPSACSTPTSPSPSAGREKFALVLVGGAFAMAVGDGVAASALIVAADDGKAEKVH